MNTYISKNVKYLKNWLQKMLLWKISYTRVIFLTPKGSWLCFHQNYYKIAISIRWVLRGLKGRFRPVPGCFPPKFLQGLKNTTASIFFFKKFKIKIKIKILKMIKEIKFIYLFIFGKQRGSRSATSAQFLHYRFSLILARFIVWELRELTALQRAKNSSNGLVQVPNFWKK